MLQGHVGDLFGGTSGQDGRIQRPQNLQPLRVSPQGLLRPLPLRDVGEDGQGTHKAARLVKAGHAADLHRQPLPVPAQEVQFVAVAPPFPPPPVRRPDDRALVGRDQFLLGTANPVLRLAAHHGRRRRVHKGQATGGVGHNDAFGHRVDHVGVEGGQRTSLPEEAGVLDGQADLMGHRLQERGVLRCVGRAAVTLHLQEPHHPSLHDHGDVEGGEGIRPLADDDGPPLLVGRAEVGDEFRPGGGDGPAPPGGRVRHVRQRRELAHVQLRLPFGHKRRGDELPLRVKQGDAKVNGGCAGARATVSTPMGSSCQARGTAATASTD